MASLDDTVDDAFVDFTAIERRHKLSAREPLREARERIHEMRFPERYAAVVLNHEFYHPPPTQHPFYKARRRIRRTLVDDESPTDPDDFSIAMGCG